jgi:hypothetical protein
MNPLPGYVTTGQIARTYQIRIGLAREILDKLGVAVRVGLYRLCPAEYLPAVEAELVRRGYTLPETEEVCDVV